MANKRVTVQAGRLDAVSSPILGNTQGGKIPQKPIPTDLIHWNVTNLSFILQDVRIMGFSNKSKGEGRNLGTNGG